VVRTRFPIGRAALLTLVFVALGLVLISPLASGPPPKPSRPLLVPFVVEAVRHRMDVAAELLVYYPGPPSTSIQVEGLRVTAGAELLVERPVTAKLIADPRYGTLSTLLERLPVELTEMHRTKRFFADPQDPQLVGEESVVGYQQAASLLQELQRDYSALGNRPFVQLKFQLPLGKIFDGDTLTGEARSIVMEVDYRGDDGIQRTAVAEQGLRQLPPAPAVPKSLLEIMPELTIHAGDLHVHSCHGEALDTCEPSDNCFAETLQVSGSFTFEELKSQYQALGIDWFTSTDHSYCINSDEEYQAIVDEIEAINDEGFIAYPDIELSTDEEGPQEGRDLGNLICLGHTQPNHMGAHGIQSRIPGGEDTLLGFCDTPVRDAVPSFAEGAATIRAEGGYPIVNHPASKFWAWNSIEATGGIESNMMHGVEIWGGSFASGQASHRGIWVDWLLNGRVLYGYSGSDTHDEAFAFGANHVLLSEPFSAENLRAALMQGRVYISNEHLLVITIDAEETQFLMGDRVAVAQNSPPLQLNIQAHYDFGADQSTITIFRGQMGDETEAVLCSSSLLSGSGVFGCTDTLSTESGSYYRAYSEDQEITKTAYTNPIFFLP
jgi:hypothetical protein